MKTILRSLLAIAAVAVFSVATPDQVSAQDYSAGYNYGLGFSSGGRNVRGVHTFRGARRGISGRRIAAFPYAVGIGGGLLERSEDLPYFAKFPPVYYSGKVKRPYGISPYAAPPGIVPTEMQNAPVAEKITNPYYSDPVNPEAKPEAETKTVGSQVDDKSAQWSANPYTGWQVNK